MKTQITNQKLYDSKVIDIDLSGIRAVRPGVLKGTISIETDARGWLNFTGEHSPDDFKNDYGFVINV